MTRTAALLALAALALAGCGGGQQVPAADLYRARCARCHGDDGRGDSRSIGLYPRLALTNSPLARAGIRGRFYLYQRIADGYGAMPGFADTLDEQQLSALTDYVLHLPQEKARR